MVCPRCVATVKSEAEKLGLPVTSVGLGELNLSESIAMPQMEILRQNLYEHGFEVIFDRKSRLVEVIKTELISIIHHHKKIPPGQTISAYLAKFTGYEYSYLSSMFSMHEGITIEKYIILQKVEKIKEWLIYDELSINEMAYKLGYSSSQHLSAQFKRITGYSPSQFRNLEHQERLPIDQVNPSHKPSPKN